MAIHLEIAVVDGDGQFVFGTGPGTSGVDIKQATPTPSRTVYRRSSRVGKKPKLWIQEITPERLSVTGDFDIVDVPGDALAPLRTIAAAGDSVTINRAQPMADDKRWVIEDIDVDEPELINGRPWRTTFTVVFVEDAD